MKFSDYFYKNAHGLVLAIALAITGIIMAFVLLCEAAQACENMDCKPDAVREWNGDTSFVDWPCGRIDTVVTEPPMDTMWSMPAPSLDDTVIVPAIEVDSLLWSIAPVADTISKPEKKTGGSHYEATYLDSNPCAMSASTFDCRPLWKRFPERWYVKSVDTTHFIIGRKVSDCFRIDTTWAKKVSLADVWLTLNQVIKLKWLVGAVPPDTIKWQDK